MSATSATSTSARLVPLQQKYDRVILLVDMDCFYCQVEEKLDPALKGQPVAVVQYNAWRGGGIIAVNYAARAKGVTRHMRGDEAKEQCPNIQLVKVPNIREKADLSKYRDAGKEVANVLQRYTQLLERASVDEAYLDITETVNKRLESLNAGEFVLKPQELINTYAVGYNTIGEYVNRITTRFGSPYMDDERFLRIHEHNDLPAVRQSDIRLLIGASIAGEIRAAVKSITGYECSAGIAHNKILAKLACGINKPNKQTILPLSEIPKLFETLAVGKITGLGGKFGEEICERLKVKYLGQLLKYTENELQRKFDEKNGSWLYYMSRGIDLEAVTPRFYSKSIGCCKKFPGRNNITGLKTLQHWLNELATEIIERLDKDSIENNRKAKQMVVSFIQEFDGQEVSSSRSAPLNQYDQEILACNALDIIKANTKTFFRAGSESALNNAIKFLGISVGKFETTSNAQARIQEMFANQAAKKRRISEDTSVNSAVEIMTEQPKERNALKIDSYFGKKDVNKTSIETEKDKPNGITIETKEQQEEAPKAEIKSYFLNALKQQKEKANLEAAAAAVAAPVIETEKSEDTINKSNEALSNLSTKKQTAPPENSYFAKFLKQQKKTFENSVQNEEVKPLSKPDASNSFFLKALEAKKRNEANKLLEANLTNTEAETKAEFEIQILAAELEEMDSSEVKTDNLCNHILTLNDAETTTTETEVAATDIDMTFDTAHITNSTQIVVTKENGKRKLNDCNADAVKDYRNDYAEFALPELRDNILNFVKCEQCGAKVPDDERSLQTHQDHHFAQQLSQQQRLEYRNELQKKTSATATKTKTSPNNNVNKKQKRANNNATNVTQKTESASITKFLKTKSVSIDEAPLSTAPSTSTAAAIAAAAEATEQCSECKAFIKVSEFPEHMDFHIAKQLQRKLNQLEVRTVAVTKKPSAVKKSQNISLLEVSQRTSNKSIAQFFTTTN